MALSTTEVEYITLVQAAKESIWIQGLLKELGFTVVNSNLIYGDNQGSIALADNPEYHARTKHIDIQYHFIRECVQSNKIDLKYCPTADMVADGITKGLPKERHMDLLMKMGVEEIEESTTLLLKSGSVGFDFGYGLPQESRSRFMYLVFDVVQVY